MNTLALLEMTTGNNSWPYQQNEQGGQELFVHKNCSLCLNTIVREDQKTTEDGKTIVVFFIIFHTHTQCVVRLGNSFTKVYIIQRTAVLACGKENDYGLHRHLIS